MPVSALEVEALALSSRGSDSNCLFRLRSELLWSFDERFWLLESSPGPGLVPLHQILARGSDSSCLFRFRSELF